MSVENEVANLTTSVDSLTEAVNVKKQTLDASVADSEAARDQSQTARDTAENHKLAAESAATSATNTASSLAGFDLEAIAASKAVSPVDVFVYDTSKDSDGGAWRKRTQHTSWYNEPLNTATRGGRREFPAVAVIVAENDKVTIYDGDDPDLPMWMVFEVNSFADPTKMIMANDPTDSVVSIINGILIVGHTGSAGGANLVNFLSDNGRLYYQNPGRSIYNGNIATRNDFLLRENDDSFLIAGNNANDVAMTVLPDAPLDEATGLPVPTIAVATDGGVSVIKDDGTVVDSGSDQRARSVGWAANGLFYDLGTNPYPLHYVADIRSVGDGFSESRRWQRWLKGNTAPVIGFSDTEFRPVSDGKTDSFGLGGDVPGLFRLVRGNDDLSVRVTSSHTTGWMNGDIKGAFLSDTDDTDLVGSGELVTNGTFDTDTSGWTTFGSGTIEYNTDGTMTVTRGGGNAGNGALQTLSNLPEGLYVFSIENTSGRGEFRLTKSTNFTGTILIGGSSGDFTFFNPVVQDISIFLNPFGTFGGDFDNISIKRADADRSVNNNGLIVNGTVTREPVAPGADLVAYSGFSETNYLEQPYNPDLDFGTGDFCVMGWMKRVSSAAGGESIVSRGDLGGNGNRFNFGLTSNGEIQLFNNTAGASNSGAALPLNSYSHVAAVRRSGQTTLYLNSNPVLSFSDSGDLDNSAAVLRIGLNYIDSEPADDSELALIRISATAPTDEQIKRIYEDEKVLFQENAQATLYGNSDAVTALAHDEVTDLLHVGSSDGRSVFQGLRRVDNTTDPVNTAISAHNGLIVEE